MEGRQKKWRPEKNQEAADKWSPRGAWGIQATPSRVALEQGEAAHEPRKKSGMSSALCCRGWGEKPNQSCSPAPSHSVLLKRCKSKWLSHLRLTGLAPTCASDKPCVTTAEGDAVIVTALLWVQPSETAARAMTPCPSLSPSSRLLRGDILRATQSQGPYLLVSHPR